jgi:capsular polysaccharide transport system permease protein
VSFLVFVMLPTIVASVYYIVYASNQYQVEFRFAVRETSQTGNAAGVASGLSALLATSAASNSAENYMVIDYLLSRQVVDELQEQIKVRDLYSRPNVDWWARFDPTQPMERFVKYWQHMVSAAYDQVTGVAAVQVRAFTPDDAHLIGVTMASLAERLVNQISQRPRLDAVKFAEQEVKRAEDRLREIRAQITEYRDKEAVIEPGSSVVTSQTTLASTLRATLTQYQTELSALTRQNLRPNAPHIVSLKSRINAVREQLAAVESQIGTSRDGSRPLSKVVGQYEQLDLERQFAQTILTSAVQSLEQARTNAIAQHLYVTPFVRPARPESSTYPNRLVSILTVGFACFFLWTIGLLVARSIGEHLA